VDGAAIERDVFAPHERAAMAMDAGGKRGGAFFRSWVRREALAKATGRGVVFPPASGDAARFGVRDLDGIPGYAAALASEGADWSVRRAGAEPRERAPRSPVRSWSAWAQSVDRAQRDDRR
jgi:hypothetical protein